MKMTIEKQWLVSFILMLTLISAILSGCGESQAEISLHSWLMDYAKQIEKYEIEVGADKSKQSEWNLKIDGLDAKWIDLRNRYGEALTPQQMENKTQEYNSLKDKLETFKKSIGS